MYLSKFLDGSHLLFAVVVHFFQIFLQYHGQEESNKE